MRKSVLLPFAAWVLGLSTLAAAAADPPAGPSSGPVAAAEAEAAAAKDLAALCAKVTCRKASRPLTLRMTDNTSFQINTRPLPYLDDKGTLILFLDESVTLSYAVDDEKLEHPILSAVSDPLGPVALPAPPSSQAVSFRLKQMDGKLGMMLTVTNTTKATVKYDAVMFVPDPADGGARGRHTSTCPLLPPQGTAHSFSGYENWPHPIVMLLITKIRALDPAAPRTCD